VKFVDERFYDLYMNEVARLREILLKSRTKREQIYVVRYYDATKLNNNHIIAMELGTSTLGEYMLKEEDPKKQENLLSLLHDACRGLKILHDIGIIHRDINPHNILVTKGDHGQIIGKLTDFGLSKKLDAYLNTMSSNPSGCGTQDWMPPELLAALDENKRYHCSRQSDIFSTGLTMFYIMSGGEHPGGVPSRRTVNIADGNLSFDTWLRKDPSSCIRFQSCISKMICKNRKDSVNIHHVLKHPWCWKPERDLQFMQDVSNYLSSKEDEVIQDRRKLKTLFSERIPFIGTNGWKGMICEKVQSYLDERACHCSEES
jgi:serine/threonine protein kinase